jgi:tetratricopeptide (TPR) repeat protein
MTALRPLRLRPWVTVALLASFAWTSVCAQLAARRGGENPNHPCGMIYTQHVGPFDYRTQRDELKIVEDFHFTPKVEMLMAGQSGFIGGDLDYTLKASPNHHRALLALVRWTERSRSDKTTGQQFPVECYFDRAIRFKPDDTVVRALYAQFLHKRKRTADALTQLQAGVEHAGDNAFSHYNLGLVYLELGEYERALAQAHKAASLGFPRTELKAQLVKLGKWQDPTSN